MFSGDFTMSTTTIPDAEQSAPPVLAGPRFLTVEQVCDTLSLSRSTVYHLIESEELPSYPLGPNGGAIRVSIDDLNAYLASKRKGGGTQQSTVTTPPKRVKLQTLTPRVAKKRPKKARASA